MYIIHESAMSSLPNRLKKNEDFVEFTAILQTADKKNRNGRYYPKSVLDSAIHSPYIEERLRTKTLYCELNHPLDASIQRQTMIDYNNIAVVIKDLYWQGNELMGLCETLPNQKGRDIMNLIKIGCRIAFSMRGQGQVHNDRQLDATVVEPGLCIITFDVVVSPSHADAYLQNICEDSFASLTHLSKYKGDKKMALTESMNLAESGQLINLGGEAFPEEIDYAKNYSKRHKPLKEYYNYSPDDKIVSISENKKILTLSSNGCAKKVTVEDFVKKDIRNRIRNI